MPDDADKIVDLPRRLFERWRAQLGGHEPIGISLEFAALWFDVPLDELRRLRSKGKLPRSVDLLGAERWMFKEMQAMFDPEKRRP